MTKLFIALAASAGGIIGGIVTLVKKNKERDHMTEEDKKYFDRMDKVFSEQGYLNQEDISRKVLNIDGE